MLRINCPWCGERNMVEFTYGGDATHTAPELSDNTTEAEYFEHVYLRNNPCGLHLEYWHHVNGCRQWLKVRRNTLTHEILEAGAANTVFASEMSEG